MWRRSHDRPIKTQAFRTHFHQNIITQLAYISVIPHCSSDLPSCCSCPSLTITFTFPYLLIADISHTDSCRDGRWNLVPRWPFKKKLIHLPDSTPLSVSSFTKNVKLICKKNLLSSKDTVTNPIDHLLASTSALDIQRLCMFFREVTKAWDSLFGLHG